ncbi:MAG: twin-arginine translocation pathway signal [Novosphingobium sp.]|nr:twin-arginine translocation pathway signal [Novosphingobium sp.]
MNRRDLIRGGLAATATLALPARALADDLTSSFDRMFAKPPALAPVPASPFNNTAYQRRVLDIARREVQKGGAKVWRRDIAGIADFAQPSAQPRFHFANLENGTVRSFYVAHGRGSDPEHCGFLQSFSNEMGSNATSRGAYLTCEWYNGKYGTSIRLEGLDRDNSQALPRAIVMHPASYAAPSMIATYGKLGRSEGCFAMAPEQFSEALWHLSGGRLLYADRIGEA